MFSTTRLTYLFLETGENNLRDSVTNFSIAHKVLAESTTSKFHSLIFLEFQDLELERSLICTIKRILEIWDRPSYTAKIAHRFFGITEVLVARYEILHRMTVDSSILKFDPIDKIPLASVELQYKEIQSMRLTTIILDRLLHESLKETLKGFLNDISRVRSSRYQKLNPLYWPTTMQKKLAMLKIASEYRNLLLKQYEIICCERKKLGMETEDLSSLTPGRIENALFLIEPLQKALSGLLAEN